MRAGPETPNETPNEALNKAPDAAPDEAPYAWVVVWACFVSLGVIFGVSYSFAALFASFSHAFQAQRADVSLVFGVSGLIYFVLGAGAGILADRFGPRVVTSSGMVVIAVGLLGSSVANSLGGVTLAFGLGVGVGIGLVYVPAISCVQPWFQRRRGLAAGLASAGIGAGTLVGPLLVAAAIDAHGWRIALRLMAGVVLLLGLAATLALRHAPSATASATAQAARVVPGHTLAQALRTPAFRWLYAMAVLASPSMFIPFAHVSAAARDLGVGDAQAVGLVGLIGVGSLLGRFGIGALADRIGRPLTLVLAQAAMGAAFVLWAGAGAYAPMAVFALCMGLSYGGCVSLMPALCMDYFGARAVASIVGVLYTAAALGNLAGPFVAGWVFDHTRSYAGVAWGCLLLSALATWAAWRAGRCRPA